jgi:hypothetical protein
LFALGAAAQTSSGLIAPAYAAEEVAVTVTIKNHRFDPAQVKVPAGKAIKLTVRNLDPSPEEFESKPLRIEKIVSGNSTIVVRIKPLNKGSYPFFGEFNEATAQGTLIAE